jgi:predicted phosphodiesterase
MGNDQSLSSKCIGIYTCSDIHTDWDENLIILKRHIEQQTRAEDKILIISGDVSADLDILEDTFILLKKGYSRVFFTFGNNEMRLKPGEKYKSSLEKLETILKICEKCSIETEPANINGVWIVPLMAWYKPSFDSGFNGDDSYRRGWLDFRECKFEMMDDTIGDHFLTLNEDKIKAILQEDARKVISFSHFLPRRDLLPFWSVLIRPTLPYVVGHQGLEDQIRKLNSSIHIFGHTHINSECVIDGIRYLQHALAHPRERRMPFSDSYQPKLIYSTNKSEKL